MNPLKTTRVRAIGFLNSLILFMQIELSYLHNRHVRLLNTGGHLYFCKGVSTLIVVAIQLYLYPYIDT